MKKLLALLLVLCSLGCFAACGDDASNTFYDYENLAEALEDEGYDVDSFTKRSEIKSQLKSFELDLDLDEMELPAAILIGKKSSQHAILNFVFENGDEALQMEECVETALKKLREDLEEKAEDEDMNLEEFLDETYNCDTWEDFLSEIGGMYEYGRKGNVYYIASSKKSFSALEDALEESLKNAKNGKDKDEDEDEDENEDVEMFECDACLDDVESEKHTVKLNGERITICDDCYEEYKRFEKVENNTVATPDKGDSWHDDDPWEEDSDNEWEDESWNDVVDALPSIPTARDNSLG